MHGIIREMSSPSEARELLRSGRIREAERAWEAVLETAPNDVEALTGLGVAALQDGRVERANDLLRRVAALAPHDASVLHPWARAQELAGDVRGAIDAYARAVAAQPTLHVARLQLGSALERTGDATGAVIQYCRALNDAQSAGTWLNAATTPAPLVSLVEHATRAVRAGRRAAFQRLFAPLAAKHGRAALQRVERCVRVYLNEERAVSPDPRQQPTFLYFPGLPATAYYDRALFPWIDGFEAETPRIREELLAVLPSERGRERVFGNDDVESANLRGGDEPPSWTGYYFWRHGERREDNCTACPVTAAALDTVSLTRVREHGPEVLFSVFTPGTHLLPHRGVTNTRLVAHLPLLVPPDCALNVGGEVHVWQEGRVVVFDDTYEHEAWNRSKQTRVVLIMDVWNPHLTDVERVAVTELVGAIGDFRHAVDGA
jgi:aspartate beta-hydroxylase